MAKEDILEKLASALGALTAKLVEIEENQEFQGIWGLAVVHGFKYTGPNWNEELKKAGEVLQEFDAQSH